MIREYTVCDKCGATNMLQHKLFYHLSVPTPYEECATREFQLCEKCVPKLSLAEVLKQTRTSTWEGDQIFFRSKQGEGA